MQYKSWYPLPVVAVVFIAIFIFGKQDITDEPSKLQALIPEFEATNVIETNLVPDRAIELNPENKTTASDTDSQQDLITQLKQAGAVTRKNYQPEVRTIELVPVAGSYMVPADSVKQIK